MIKDIKFLSIYKVVYNEKILLNKVKIDEPSDILKNSKSLKYHIIQYIIKVSFLVKDSDLNLDL